LDGLRMNVDRCDDAGTVAKNIAKSIAMDMDELT
jgi:hypothetical protein